MDKNKKILMVDDDRNFLESVKTVLTKKGFEVVTAKNGDEGMRKALSEQLDLVILDVMMPGQDGWDLCDSLRSKDELRNIPIIYFTCVEAPKSLYQSHGAFETDWDEYLTKPVTPKKLLETVEKLLEKDSS